MNSLSLHPKGQVLVSSSYRVSGYWGSWMSRTLRVPGTPSCTEPGARWLLGCYTFWPRVSRVSFEPSWSFEVSHPSRGWTQNSFIIHSRMNWIDFGGSKKYTDQNFQRLQHLKFWNILFVHKTRSRFWCHDTWSAPQGPWASMGRSIRVLGVGIMTHVSPPLSGTAILIYSGTDQRTDNRRPCRGFTRYWFNNPE